MSSLILTINVIFRCYAPQYLEKFANRIMPSHRRAIRDIINCRTLALGWHIDQCTSCKSHHLFFHSCYNRVCPQCQNNQAETWLRERQTELLRLGNRFFHVVFTVPSELHPIIRDNQNTAYGILFRAAADSVIKLMADPHYAGGIPGMLCVLHTWTNTLTFHPHIHCLIPAGVIAKIESENKQKDCQDQWIPIQRDYLMPEEALADIFRARFAKLIRKALPDTSLPPAIWKKNWINHIEAHLENPKNVFQYLARYVFRVAIPNSRIVSHQNGQVTFKYKDSNDKTFKEMTLRAEEFIRRFLQHVLPRGFHKVRYYGFLAPSIRKEFFSLFPSIEPNSSSHNNNATEKNTIFRKCPTCKNGNLIVIAHVFPYKLVILNQRAPP